MIDNPTGSNIFDSIFNEHLEVDAGKVETPPEQTEEAPQDEPEATEVEQTEEAEGEEQTEEPEAEAEAEEPKKFSIKAAGETHELTEAELIEYAQKGIGFNRNSELKAKEHKAAMAEAESLKQNLLGELEKAKEYLDVFAGSEEGKKHLDYLLNYDADEYKRITRLQETVKSRYQELKADSDAAQVQNALDLLERTYPAEWATQAKRQSLLGEGIEFFKSVGLDDSQIAEIKDGHSFVAAIKAKRFDDLMKKAQQNKVAATPKKSVQKVAQATKEKRATIADINPVDEFFPFLK